jgi:hypothetical protein
MDDQHIRRHGTFGDLTRAQRGANLGFDILRMVTPEGLGPSSHHLARGRFVQLSYGAIPKAATSDTGSGLKLLLAVTTSMTTV